MTGEKFVAMHTLTRATLVAGSETPAGDGLTGALKRVITDTNGKKFSAYLKKGSLEEVLSEALASLLLSGWGLPIPKPYLVQHGADLYFASADAKYPSLKKRFNLDQLPSPVKEQLATHAAALVCSFKSAPLAAACDEAIDNRDRNLGNVLWDGSDEAWIDHAYCFGVGNQPDQNKLCAMAVAIGEIDRMQRSSLASALTLDKSLTSRASMELSSASLDVSAMVEHVDHRLRQIGQLILARFPQPTDLLS